MARISVSVSVDRPKSEVWARLSQLQSHHEWMSDAESIEFEGPVRRGVGTKMVVATRVGPLRTKDVMEVTGWVEGESITVEHRGLVRGVGTLAVDEKRAGSVVAWTEELRFPWWLGGPVTAWFARPILRRIWLANLRRFAGLVSGP